MELVTLYEKRKNGFCDTWFSLDDRCRNQTEIVREHKYVVPEGFEVCKDRTGEPHFYVKGRRSDDTDYAELGTDLTNGCPYLYGIFFNTDGSLRRPDERVYLKRPTNNKD